MQPDDNTQQPNQLQSSEVQTTSPQQQTDDTLASPDTSPESVDSGAIGTEPSPDSASDVDGETATGSRDVAEETLLTWQSAEYIQHNHSSAWYIGLILVTVGLMAVAIWLIKSVTFAILLPVMAVALIVYTRRPPATVDYGLTTKGLYVRDKLYLYGEFKAFNLLTHDGVNSVHLIPRRRFQLGQSIYFPTEIGEELVDILATYLPMKTRDPDLYDRIISKLRM